MSDKQICVCAECDEGIIKLIGAGDELWHYCPMCESVEGKTKQVSEEEAENYSEEQ